MSGSAAVVVRRISYPQVAPRARDLMDDRLALVPRGLPVGAAARLARRRGAHAVAARLGTGWGAATAETLAEALRLGLDDAPLEALLWDAPAVPPELSEIAVRRRLGPARPLLLVAWGGEPRGVVRREAGSARPLPLAAADRLARLPEPARGWLRRAGAVGDELRMRVAAVGGLVRDLFLERIGDPVDLDLVVEGSAAAVARRLAAVLGGRVVEHPAFLTATVEAPDGRRLDLATARRERYRAPGALPDVAPASLDEDLARRDFSVNALAIRLDRDAWGALVDPTGGLADVRARRLRVLHPLSFVEDPTRVFRAARFAVRLGCRVDGTTRRLARRACELDVYAALSGDRLRAELLLALAEPAPAAVLREAARLGAWRLVAPGLRVDARRARLLAGAAAESSAGPGGAGALAILALSGGGPAAEAAAARLGLSPALREAIRRARLDGPRLLRGLAGAEGPAAAYRLLDGAGGLTAAWARLLGGTAAARRYLDLHLGPWRALPALATGDDVAALGVPRGPAVGALLRELRAAQAAGQVESRAAALRWLTRAARRRAGAPESPTRAGQRGG